MCVAASRFGGNADESFLAAPAVEPAADSRSTMESATDSCSATEPAAGEPASCNNRPTTDWPANESAPAHKRMARIEAAAVEAVIAPAMEPWACADEDAIHEVIRAPVAIRRAGVRSVRVIAVSANRGWSNHCRTDSHCHGSNSNPDSHSHLRVRGACREK